MPDGIDIPEFLDFDLFEGISSAAEA